VMASTQAPLNMIAWRIFCGGFASVDARRASCAAKDDAEKRKKRKNQQRRTAVMMGT
jgi:hypothetical protein